MYENSDSSGPTLAGRPLEVLLDGVAVALPAQRSSLAGVRAYLETLALDQHRILCSFKVDGEMVGLNGPVVLQQPFVRVEAESLDLAQMPLQLVRAALEQAGRARTHTLAAVTLVIINSSREAREIWWDLVQELKQPLLTLSLMPETIGALENGSASLMQLRKWQLQQLAAIIKEVDVAACSPEPFALSSALEQRVLPWLQGLVVTLDLWQVTLLVGQYTPAVSPQQ